jgi:hypothetical protein
MTCFIAIIDISDPEAPKVKNVFCAEPQGKADLLIGACFSPVSAAW